MASAGNEAENWVLDALLGDNHVASSPATVYIALFTSLATDASAGTEPGAASVTAYQRVAVTNNSTNWPAASGGVKSNGTAITFAEALTDWGTIVGWGIMQEASGAGVPILHGELDNPEEIVTGMTPEFDVFDLVIYCD